MADQEEPQATVVPTESHPFLNAVGRYAKSLPKRLMMVPVNAIKFPGRLISEVTGNAEGAVAAENMQRSLAGQVTGQTPEPFDKSRQMANFFTLGLAPGQKSAAVDPNALDPQQHARFDRMSRLQQALVTAQRPSDFVNLLHDDSLFHEDPVQKPFIVGRDDRAIDPKTGQVMLDAQPRLPQNVPVGGALVGPDGNEIYRNDDPMAQPKLDAANRKTDAEIRGIDQKIAESKAKVEQLTAQARKADAEARAADRKANGTAAPEAPTLADRAKIQGMESKEASRVLTQTKDLDRGMTAGQNFFQLYELRDAAGTPPQYVRELMDMGFKDPSTGIAPIEGRDPRSLQDLMLVQLGVRAADPPGRITDKDVDMFSRARAYFDPGIVDAVMKGQVLTDRQRNEMAVAVKKLTAGVIQRSDAAVVAGRNAALRDRLAGKGVGMNPLNIPDPGVRARSTLYGKSLGDQAAFPLANRETEQLLEQLWMQQKPNEQPTAQGLVDWANTHGFRVSEFAQPGDGAASGDGAMNEQPTDQNEQDPAAAAQAQPDQYAQAPDVPIAQAEDTSKMSYVLGQRKLTPRRAESTG